MDISWIFIKDYMTLYDCIYMYHCIMIYHTSPMYILIQCKTVKSRCFLDQFHRVDPLRGRMLQAATRHPAAGVFPWENPLNQWVRYSEIGGFRVTQPLQITTVTAPVRHQALGVGPPALRPLLGMFWSNNVCAAQGKRQLDEHPQLFFLGTWVHWVRKSPNWCYPYILYILYCKTMDMKHF